MRHRYFLLAQVLTIVAVITLFRTVDDRKIAATVAGFIFVAVPSFFLGWDFKVAARGEPLQLIWRFAVLQFLVLFAIPIFWARVFHWNMEFADISVAGVPAALLHRLSNASFTVMMLGTLSKIVADFLALRRAGAPSSGDSSGPA